MLICWPSNFIPETQFKEINLKDKKIYFHRSINHNIYNRKKCKVGLAIEKLKLYVINSLVKHYSIIKINS